MAVNEDVLRQHADAIASVREQGNATKERVTTLEKKLDRIYMLGWRVLIGVFIAVFASVCSLIVELIIMGRL